jgi:hypothetical protein
VKRWFYNNGRKRDRKDRVRYVRKWNLKQVVGHMEKARIEEVCKEQTGSNPGTRNYLGGYQKALTDVVDNLSEEEVSGYRKMAREWTMKSPPEHVQRK